MVEPVETTDKSNLKQGINMEEKEDWWYQDYDPKISIETWLKLLHDGNIFNFNSMCMMKRLLYSGGKSSNTELSKKYGRSANSYTGIGNQLAKRIMQKSAKSKCLASSISRQRRNKK